MSNHGAEKRPRNPVEGKMDRPRQHSSYPPIPDCQSEAQLVNLTKFRRNCEDPEKSGDEVHSEYSVSETGNEDSEATSSSPMSDDEDEEEEEIKPVSPAKRRRINSEMHKLSEKKRRERINEKMRALRALIPNSDKVDKVSMLDKAIEYLKSLQLQLQFQLMVTMGSRLCTGPSPMMLGMQQMQAADVTMRMRMPIGAGFCQFPNPNMPSLFAGGMVPLPLVSQPPFMPLVAGSSALPMPCNSSSGSILDPMYINNNRNVNSRLA